jgi:hypothetical protein
MRQPWEQAEEGKTRHEARGCARAGNSVDVLLSRYAKCLYDRQSINHQRIEGLLSSYDQPPDLDEQRPGRRALSRR